VPASAIRWTTGGGASSGRSGTPASCIRAMSRAGSRGGFSRGGRARGWGAGRMEWWIVWRRVAGGLSAGQQEQIHAQLAPSLVAGPAKRSKEGKRLGKQEQAEMWGGGGGARAPPPGRPQNHAGER